MSRETRPRPRRAVAWALALGLFAAGVAAGVAGDRLLGGRPAARREGPPTSGEIAERLTRELDLTDAQARAVRAILDERREALEQLTVRFDPAADAIRRAADERVRSLLDPAQRERFERRIAERERRRAEARTRVQPR